MCAYEPKHMRNDESMGAQIREAGRKVLHGTLSVILAASLVPATPITVYAEENQPVQQQGDGQQQGEGQQQQQQQQPQEQPPAEQQQQQGGEGQQQEQQGGEGQQQGSDQQQQGEGQQQQGEGQQQQQGGEQQQQQQGEGQQQQQQQQNQGGEKKTEESKGSDDQKKDESKKDDDQTKNNDGKKLTQQDEQVLITQSCTYNVNKNLIGEEFGGRKYINVNDQDCKIVLQVSHDSGFTSVGKGVLHYRNKSDNSEAELKKDAVFDDTRNNATFTFNISELGVGSYDNFWVSVSDVVANGQDSESYPTGTSDPDATIIQVVDATAPELSSVKLKNSSDADYVKDGKSNLVAGKDDSIAGNVSVEYGDANAIEILVNDDALNTTASKVEAFDLAGRSLGNGTFIKDNDSYKCRLATGVDSDITGRIGLKITTQGLGNNSAEQVSRIGLNTSDKADSSLIIDGKAPVIKSVKAGDDDLELISGSSEDIVSNSDSVIVTIADASLDVTATNSYVALYNGESKEAGDATFTEDGENPGTYNATLNISSVADGTYQVKVFAKDTFFNEGDDAAKGRHEAVEATYGNLVVDTVAPTITSAEVKKSETQKTSVATGARCAGNTLEVVFNDTNLDTTATSVTLNKSDGNALTVTPSWNEAGDTLTISNIPEDTYTITIHPEDEAGNAPAQDVVYTNVVIDGTAPRVGNFGYTASKSYNETTIVRLVNGTVAVTVPVTDLSYERPVQGSTTFDGISFNVTKDGATYSVTPSWGAWNSDTRTATATLSFSEEGTYSVSVSGEDGLGNTIANTDIHTETFVVAAAPTATITQLPGSIELSTTGTERKFVNKEEKFKFVIEGNYIDEASTTIASVPLSTISDNLPNEASTYTPNGKNYTFSSLSVTKTDSKVTKYEVNLTYGESETDEEYAGDDLPVAKVKDWYLAVDSESTPISFGTFQPFTVDLTAPSVVYSAPTTMANIDLLDATGSAQNGKIIFFNRKGEENRADHLRYGEGNLVFAIIETLGLDSVTPITVTNDGDSTAYNTGEGKTYTVDKDGHFSIELIEDLEFRDTQKIIVRDRAGNTSTWTLKDIQSVSAGISETTNNALTDSKNSITVQQPRRIVEDGTKPELTLNSEEINGKYFSKNAGNTGVIHLNIKELNYTYLKQFAGSLPLLKFYRWDNAAGTTRPTTFDGDITKTIGDAIEKTSSAKIDGKWSEHEISVSTDDLDDGHYYVEADLTDLAGNVAGQATIAQFTVDKKAPTFTVGFEGAPLVQETTEKEYFADERIAVITVTEHNFDAGKFTVSWSQNNPRQNDPAPSYEWKDVPNTDTHICRVKFPADGEYTLSVSGEDLAGNKAECKTTSTIGYTSPKPFVIDSEQPIIADIINRGEKATTDPTVVFPSPTGQYAGVNYYSHGISIDALVRDRNLNTAKSTIDGKTATWSLKSRDDATGFEVYGSSVSYTDDGVFYTPKVDAVDFAENKSTNAPKKFVIDLAAPSISVQVDQQPTSTGSGNDQNDPIQFFNVATSMTFTMNDPHGLRSYNLHDPENEYEIKTTTQNVEGKNEATFTIGLRDGANAANDTEYERNIELTVQDLAGNQRIWTIDRTGKVVADRTDWAQNTPANRSINNADIYPVALIQDTTAPVISLAGVTPGTYYNSTQVVRATVNEFNFDYLKRFDPSRVLVTVIKREGNAGRAQSSWTIPASSFNGERPVYVFDQPFESDGHYELSAEFLDYANNPSNRATIGEFTIDKTAPVITVTWNSPAGNAPYYRETRVATITVVEHNFDPSLFTINTTGSISGWSSDGDTHTCTVTFDADGRYTLAVSGRDQAGNEAAAYNEPEFTIDKTAPKITFGGTVQRYGVDRGTGSKQNEFSGNINDDGAMPDPQSTTETLQDHHAYNGVVMPTIEFVDQSGNGFTNYNASATDYTLTGGKHGKDYALVDKYNPVSVGGGQRYEFEDFGLIVKNDGDRRNVYDPEADDVYTIDATMADLAGNTASAKVTFSVNRYGSNFIVTAYADDGTEIKGDSSIAGIDYHLLGTAPSIEVTEVNVSGSESEADHSVLKEYANAVKPIKVVKKGDSGKSGYELESNEGTESATKYGWSEYHYSIRKGNFGQNSDSDTGDGGQGVYRVNVTSVDRASNDTSSAEFVDTDAKKKDDKTSGTLTSEDVKNMLRNATANFTLDELAPAIDELNVPSLFHFGTSYEATVHISDAITDGDTVKVFLDGRELSEGEFTQRGSDDGTGTYKFSIGASALPFVTHEVKVVASDGFESHEVAEMTSNRFMVGILLPEIALLALVVGGITGGVIFYRKRMAVKEPDEPGSYE